MRHKPKRALPLGYLGAVKIGRQYSAEKIWKLIEDMGSEEENVRVGAVTEFAKHHVDIAESLDEKDEAKMDALIEKAIQEALRDQEKILAQLVRINDRRILNFWTHTPVAPAAVKATARKALQSFPQIKRAPVPRKYTSAAVKEVVVRLQSPNRQERVAAAVRVLNNYHPIAREIGQMPDMNITQINKQLVQVVERNLHAVLVQLGQQRMKRGLNFVIWSKVFSGSTRKKAQNLARMLFGYKPAAPARQEAPVKPLKEESLAARLVQEWVVQLKGPDREKRVEIAIQILDKHQEVATAVSQMPGITISEINQVLVRMIERNLEQILGELKRRRMDNVLYFIANSHLFNRKIQLEAMGVFRILRNLRKSEGKR